MTIYMMTDNVGKTAMTDVDDFDEALFLVRRRAGMTGLFHFDVNEKHITQIVDRDGNNLYIWEEGSE